MSYNLEANNHSVFLLYYHMVLVTKYRRCVINDDVSNRLREIFVYMQLKNNIALKNWNHDNNHVHILFNASPVTMLSKFISSYKSASSRIIKQEFSHISYFLWKSSFWSSSYCLLSTGGAPVNIIKKYIENQGKRC